LTGPTLSKGWKKARAHCQGKTAVSEISVGKQRKGKNKKNNKDPAGAKAIHIATHRWVH
jgi:hypothetical protein